MKFFKFNFTLLGVVLFMLAVLFVPRSCHGTFVMNVSWNVIFGMISA